MANPPNILLITSDQQHHGALGAVNPRLRTPALDRLCAEGTRFDRAYCPNPVCSPTRSSILTGMYPSVHGCWTIGVRLPEDVPTVGRYLAAQGYATGLIGKAHFQPLASSAQSPSLECQPTLRDLDFWRHFHGPWYGFDHIEVARNHADEAHAGQHYAIWMEDNGLPDWRDYFQSPDPGARRDQRRRRWSWDLPERFHYSAWTAERTMAFIERCQAAGRPFLCWASFHDPHPPYLVSAPWDRMYAAQDMAPGVLTPGEHERNPPHFRRTQEPHPDFSPWREAFGVAGLHSHLQDPEELRRDIAVYYGMISLMDHHIGRILDRLDQLGLERETLVVFTSDHGHFLGHHGLNRKGPFHYEDMIRVPFIVRHPGRVPAGRVGDELVSLVDLAPTFLRAAGAPVPGAMQGVDQDQAWRGQGAVRDHVLVENRCQGECLSLRSYVTRTEKLTIYGDYGRDTVGGASYGEFFDLARDPAEVANLWDEPAAQSRKGELAIAFVRALIASEPTRQERVAGA